MKYIVTTILLISAFLASGQSYNSPESIEFDYANNRWFVANHGAGEILIRSSATGAVSLFASGFTTGPHGLEIVNDTIYACDGSNLRAYNISTGAPVFNINLGASFLNGITHDNSGNLIITDFTAKKIFRFAIATRQFNVFVTGLTKSPNGIIYDQPNNRSVFVNWGTSAPIMAVSMTDSTVSTLTATSLSNCDGITKDGAGNYYVSSWGANAIHKFNNSFTGGPITVVTGLSSPADIFYNTVTDTLGVPNSGSTGANANKPTFHYFGSTTGISERAAEELAISPNPASNGIAITFDRQQFDKPVIKLLDPEGRMIQIIAGNETNLSNGVVCLDCSGIPTGIYIICIEDSTRKIFSKLSVVH